MPQTKSAKKALRRDRRREATNKLVRQGLKNALRLARKKVSSKNLTQASRALDMAAKKGVIPKKRADRLKSRLAKITKTDELPVATKAKRAKKRG